METAQRNQWHKKFADRYKGPFKVLEILIFFFYFEKGQLYKEMHMERNTTRNEEPPIHNAAKRRKSGVGVIQTRRTMISTGRRAISSE